MSHRIIIWLVLIPVASLLTLTTPLWAQKKAQPLLVGPAVFLNLDYLNSTIPVFAGSPTCGEFHNGWLRGPSLGGRISYPKLFNNRLGISGQALIAALTGRFSTPAPEAFILYDNTTNQTEKSLHEYRLSFQTLSLKLDILLDYVFSGNVHIHAGPSIGIRLATTIEQTDYITDDVFRFNGGIREQQMSSRPDLVQEPLILGAKVGASYEMALNKQLTIAPEFFIGTEFSPLFTGTQQFAISGAFGISVMTNLLYNDPPPPVPNLTIATPPPPPPTLKASLNVKSIDMAGTPQSIGHIRIYETFHRSDTATTWEVERELEPPTLLINPNYDSPAGISQWRVRFLYGKNVIGEATHENTDALSRIDWRIGSTSQPDSLQKLHVELSVTDSSGVTALASDTIPLQIERFDRIVERSKNRLDLSLFPVPSGEDILSKRNLAILAGFASEVKEGEHIQIIGLSQTSEGSQRKTLTWEEILRIETSLRTALANVGVERISITRSLPDKSSEKSIAISANKTVRPQVRIILERTAR